MDEPKRRQSEITIYYNPEELIEGKINEKVKELAQKFDRSQMWIKRKALEIGLQRLEQKA